MIAVITGDIINSRESKASDWLGSLKNALNRYGNSPEDWDVYGGDSFQLKTNMESSLEACLYIKACIKQFNTLDVRMAIGTGSSKGPIGKITEEQGEAFYRSGKCFENLKSNHLAINTGDKKQDTILNLMLDLGLLTFDAWSSIDSLTLKVVLEHPEFTQKQIAGLLEKSPSTLSFTLRKIGYKEIQSLLKYYKSIMINQ
jgi:hypothetical protein